jgi:hypothetical protein
MNLIQTARNHVSNGAPMESSARLCLADAIRNHDEGNYQRAYFHALKSLGYSIGIMHADYRKAWATVHGSEPARLVTAMDYIEATEGDENAPVESVPRYINQVTDMGVTRPLSRAIRVF